MNHQTSAEECSHLIDAWQFRVLHHVVLCYVLDVEWKGFLNLLCFSPQTLSLWMDELFQSPGLCCWAPNAFCAKNRCSSWCSLLHASIRYRCPGQLCSSICMIGPQLLLSHPNRQISAIPQEKSPWFMASEDLAVRCPETHPWLGIRVVQGRCLWDLILT